MTCDKPTKLAALVKEWRSNGASKRERLEAIRRIFERRWEPDAIEENDKRIVFRKDYEPSFDEWHCIPCERSSFDDFVNAARKCGERRILTFVLCGVCALPYHPDVDKDIDEDDEDEEEFASEVRRECARLGDEQTKIALEKGNGGIVYVNFDTKDRDSNCTYIDPKF